MFLEADISFFEEKHSEPIMAHPPKTDGDLKFSEWLEMSANSGKGLKLDFKTNNSVGPCLEVLSSIKNKVGFFFELICCKIRNEMAFGFNLSKKIRFF